MADVLGAQDSDDMVRALCALAAAAERIAAALEGDG
jgi:hypothetical protein